MDDGTNKVCRMACGFGREKWELPMAMWVNSAGFGDSQGPWRRKSLRLGRLLQAGLLWNAIKCPWKLQGHIEFYILARSGKGWSGRWRCLAVGVAATPRGRIDGTPSVTADTGTYNKIEIEKGDKS